MQVVWALQQKSVYISIFFTILYIIELSRKTDDTFGSGLMCSPFVKEVYF